MGRPLEQPSGGTAVIIQLALFRFACSFANRKENAKWYMSRPIAVFGTAALSLSGRTGARGSLMH